MMPRAWIHTACALICWLGLATTSYAEPVQGAQSAPAYILTEVPQAVMQGQGTYRWFGLSIYDATLWTGPGGWSDQLKQKIALDLRYSRSLLGRKIAEASLQEIEKLQRGSVSQRQIWLQQLIALFPDVKEGSLITGIWVPNEAARFYLDGKWLGEIRDADFANAFFAIWLDPHTSAPDLRNKLLALRPPSH